VPGCVNPIADIVEWAHAVGAKVLVDGCQSVPHMPVDVQALGADFLVASSHKVTLEPYELRISLKRVQMFLVFCL